MSTTTNYTLNGAARKVDLYVMGAFDFAQSTAQKTSPTLAVESGGQVCTGMVKLAQKVIGTLLSYNVFFDFDWGTQLTPFIMAGSTAQVRRVLSKLLGLVCENVVSQLKNNETDTMPLDERIKALSAQGWTLDTTASKVSVTLNLLSQTNESMPIVVPISVVP